MHENAHYCYTLRSCTYRLILFICNIYDSSFWRAVCHGNLEVNGGKRDWPEQHMLFSYHTSSLQRGLLGGGISLLNKLKWYLEYMLVIVLVA